MSDAIALLSASASGAAIALAAGNALARVLASAIGTSTANAYPSSSATSTANAVGTSTAEANGQSALTAAGSSSGLATVLGYWQKAGYTDISVAVEPRRVPTINVTFQNFSGVHVVVQSSAGRVQVDLPAKGGSVFGDYGHRTYNLKMPAQQLVLAYTPSAFQLRPASQV